MEFTTSNYGVKTTQEKEYMISTGRLECPAEDTLDKKGRLVSIILRVEELEKLVLARRAKLTPIEILAVVRNFFFCSKVVFSGILIDAAAFVCIC